MVEILYFSAKWCNPCRQMPPIIESLKADGIKVTKIDIDDEPGLSRQYGIMAVPTFVFVKDGTSVRKLTGARDKATLMDAVTLASQ